MSNQQSTVGVAGAEIGDQSRACETRSCFFGIFVSYSTSVLIHILNKVHTLLFCITFSELYIISKLHGRAVLKAGFY